MLLTRSGQGLSLVSVALHLIFVCDVSRVAGLAPPGATRRQRRPAAHQAQGIWQTAHASVTGLLHVSAAMEHDEWCARVTTALRYAYLTARVHSPTTAVEQGAMGLYSVVWTDYASPFCTWQPALLGGVHREPLVASHTPNHQNWHRLRVGSSSSPQDIDSKHTSFAFAPLGRLHPMRNGLGDRE